MDPIGQAAAEAVEVGGFAAHDARLELVLRDGPQGDGRRRPYRNGAWGFRPLVRFGGCGCGKRRFVPCHVAGRGCVQGDGAAAEPLQAFVRRRLEAGGEKHLGVAGPDGNVGEQIGRIARDDAFHVRGQIFASGHLRGDQNGCLRERLGLDVGQAFHGPHAPRGGSGTDDLPASHACRLPQQRLDVA